MHTDDMKKVYFSAGNRKLTLRVKKLAVSKGRTVSEKTHWNGFGYAVSGYYCDEDILNEVKEGIAKEEAKDKIKQEKKAAALRAELERRESQRRIDVANELRSRFPHLPDAILNECLAPGIHAYGMRDEISPDLYSRREWKLLGGEVAETAKPQAYVIRETGRVRQMLFSRRDVSELKQSRSGWSDERLWKGWRRGFQSDLLAVATAVQFANRLVKLSPFSLDKRAFYAAKDRFLRFAFPQLVEGRVSREETSSCWGCLGEECFKCCGTGIYSSRTLYEHHYLIDGQAVLLPQLRRRQSINCPTNQGQTSLPMGDASNPLRCGRSAIASRSSPA